MFRKTLLSLAVASTVSLTGCLDSGGQTDENANIQNNTTNPLTDDRVYPIFNPVTSELPVPNDILFAKETAADGTMFAGVDATNPVITAIDYMDGNSVTAAFDIKLSGSIDKKTVNATSFIAQSGAVIPNPGQTVFLLPLTYPSGDGLSQAKVNDTSVEIPTFAEAITYQTAAATGDIATLQKLATPSIRAEVISLDDGVDNVIRLTPLTPLMPETKYLAVITSGVKDTNGNSLISSTSYQTLRDPNAPIVNAALTGVRSAILGWEQLANGYFNNFMKAVFDKVGMTYTAPDIAFSMTFTTGGTDSVLKSIASPGTFFEKSLRTGYKQDAISKLVSGTYNLSGDNSQQTSITDGAINTTINVLLTQQLLDLNGDGTPETPNALYNATLAAAIDAGANYSTLASASASSAFLMQKAAAEAAIAVHNSGNPARGDADSFTIAQTAAGTALSIATELGKLGQTLPMPAARTTNFYQMDSASSLNSALAAPAIVSQGEITLPYYLSAPEGSDPTNIVTGSWQANTTIGAIIDTFKGNDAGTTPPSSKVTYRYPFPSKQADVTVPLLAVSPAAMNYGTVNVEKPANGWPVIIYQHGITTDRSTILPMADAMAFSCVNTNNSASPVDWAPSGLPCFATIAIDQPLHGVAGKTSLVPGLNSVSNTDVEVSGNIGTPSANLQERHFNFTADATLKPVAVDYSVTSQEKRQSGSFFLNLNSFATSRDNLRQAAVDLMNLNASIANMDIDGNPNNQPDLDASRVYFIAYSLGGLDGVPYLAINNDSEVSSMNGLMAAISQGAIPSPLNTIVAASAPNTAGGIAKLAENSPSPVFGGPRIIQSLSVASNGVLSQGRTSYETYFSVFQGLLDSVDPVTFATKLNNGNTGILVSEIIGNTDTGNPSDQTVPNAADEAVWGEGKGPLKVTLGNGFMIDNLPAPLSGTEPMSAQLGASKTAEATANPKVISITRFTEGNHETPITAGSTGGFDSNAVFVELVKEQAYLFGTNGTAAQVFDTSVVED